MFGEVAMELRLTALFSIKSRDDDKEDDVEKMYSELLARAPLII